MNGQAQMSGQVSGRMTNQANQQMKGMTHPIQMNGRGTQIMDNDLNMSRHHMRTRITQYLQRRTNNPYAEQRLHDLAKKLEDRIFKDAASTEDYMNMTVGPIEQRLQSIIKSASNNNRSLSQHTSSSSSMNTMIPTPGMTHNSNTNTVVSGIVAQTAPNSGKFRPVANGSTASVPNRYQRSPVNMALGSGGNSMVSLMGTSQPLNQMIPTPGLNNLQQISMISDSSHGVGFSQQQHQQQLLQQQQQQLQPQQQQQQKQYVGVQNTRTSHALGGQIGVGSKPSLQQKAYGFSNGVVNGGLGLIGNNMYMMNGQAASESFLNTTSRGSPPKHLQQQFDQQYHPPILPTSLSQQMLPMAGDGYGMNTADLSVSNNLYGSLMDDQNLNNMSLNSKLKSNHAFSTHNSSLQSMQQPPLIKSQYGNSQKMNFQSSQSREHLMQPQEQIQIFQQQSNQTYGQLVQNQHQQEQQNSHQQQLLLKADNLRQSSITSDFEGQLISEHGIEAAEQFDLQELQSQYQQNTSAGNHSRGAQYLDHLAVAQDSQPALRQASQQMLQAQQQVTASQHDYSSLLSVPEPDAFPQGHWHPQVLQKSQMPEEPSSEQHIQEELQQRLTGWEEAQQPHFDSCTTGHAAATSVSATQSSSGIACVLGKSIRERNYLNLQRWLLFLSHARWCSAPEGTCKAVHCTTVKQLVKHTSGCKLNQCAFRRCRDSRKLIEHFEKCKAADCPVCIPMRNFVASKRKAHNRPLSGDGLANQSSDSWRAISSVVPDSVVSKTGTSLCETSEDRQSMKRMKIQHTDPSLVPNWESSPISAPVTSQPHLSQDYQPQRADTTTSTKPEAVEVTIDSYSGFGQEKHTISAKTVDQSVHVARPDTKLIASNDVVNHVKEENMLIEADNDQVKVEDELDANGPSDPVAGSKTGKPKIKGVSLTELFTPEQIREHIRSLRQWVGQSKAKAEKNQAMEHLMSENSCQLCAVEKLAFEPPPIYCTPCGARIKRNASYYTIATGDTRHYFCVPCYNEARGDTIVVDGSSFPKTRFEKKKNDEESEEWWVQCDKCEAWQHQICALFNGRRNDGGQAEYTCPNCYIDEIEKGERKPLPQSSVLGAKDLPRTILSDHIEQRLFRRLKHERQERARHLGKSFDEVPGAEALVVRVVSSVDKKLEVKQRFLEIFQEENYSTEFPYKSKVILLFQKIDGVEVCLFGMYVQEFGSECQFPNQRRVYLSYLDSVKYFRPETRTVSGEALRTFVYHEILIGYLEYCKKRGFTSCYIWACPPLKGEDYILYCHPEIQKTPKSDKLREWYLSMLRKACKENIVVDLINLYDHFFTSVGECKAKVTAARLPYFDGDYWPGAAEDMINQLSQEEDDKKQQKKGKTKKIITKRALKAAGQTDLTGNASKDALLMQKLGETIFPMKEDFIMVHLQHACTHCCLLMVSGTRWVCKSCKNFQLCDKCHDIERRLEERDRHPVNSREKHMLCSIEITDVSSDTKDKDEILESEFFDTRQAFLSLCQGNHYQYDTLRRAKHSSMMVLYHLHNPTAPAFVTTCNVCHHDIETGQGWRCEICPDFDVCNACYQKDGAVDHPHKLTNHPSLAERDAQNQEARQKRVSQLRKMLDLLVHASQCRIPHCSYPNCRKVKGLFRHGIQCKTRASGGCHLCKKMWYLLQLHSRACKESDCHVPRCKDLKEHLRRLQQQSESRRRAAVMEMMRQRAAEVAGSNE